MINIKTDSRKVKKGDIFVAIKGNTVDGHDFINKAIENGASKIISEKNIDCDIENIVVSDTKKYLDDLLSNNYYEHIKDLKLIGITGTNGKTTTAYLTSQILTKLGIKNAYIGTIGYYINSELIKELPNTTPEILEVYNLLYEAKENNCEVVVMEVSSHALSFDRIKGLKFSLEAFTNLTQDHLDYHKTMENYLNAKLQILNYLKDDGIIIVNNDDSYSKYFISDKSKTIGINNSFYNIDRYDFDSNNTNIEFTVNNKKYNVKTNLSSKFNVYNYMTALSLVNNLGIDIESIINITKDIYPPKGRVETYKVNGGTAIIDYAHTPDAVEKIINSVKEYAKGKIITVIGCGGNRDRGKRPIMGKIASDNSDYVIFTNDNPRLEDEKIIMQDIINGVKKDNYEIIYNRDLAIKKALDIIEENDVVLILGKGHEDYQILGKVKVHFSDSEQVENYIKEHK